MTCVVFFYRRLQVKVRLRVIVKKEYIVLRKLLIKQELLYKTLQNIQENRVCNYVCAFVQL